MHIPDDDVRPGDTERTSTLDRLAAAHAEGRLAPSEHERRVRDALTASTLSELRALTADLPVPAAYQAALKREQDRRDLHEWLAEWRYWLGGAVIMTAIWGVRSVKKGEPTFYWPLVPLAVWAAILIAIAIWPRKEEKPIREDGDRPAGSLEDHDYSDRSPSHDR